MTGQSWPKQRKPSSAVMNMQKFTKNQPAAINKEELINLEFIQKEVHRLNSLSAIIYEIKAGTTYGKLLLLFIHLLALQNRIPDHKVHTLNNICLSTMADLTGVTPAELGKSLEYLQQQGVLTCKRTVD